MRIEDKVYVTVMNDIRACLKQEKMLKVQAMNFISLLLVRFAYLEEDGHEITDEELFAEFSLVIDRMPNNDEFSDLETQLVPKILKKVYTAFIDLEMSISNQ